MNEYETEYFDCLSPTLFAFDINDLATKIKNSNVGVNIHEDVVLSVLFYADDIVLLAENEEDLQHLLYIVKRRG